jgi:hypothetical protein
LMDDDSCIVSQVIDIAFSRRCQDIVTGLRIDLTDDGMMISLEEGANVNLKILDVLIGPFDLQPTSL